MFDFCIIGSSLSAMGFLHGLAENPSFTNKHILVLLDPRNSSIGYPRYEHVPLELLRTGGLSTAWHSIIPLNNPCSGYKNLSFSTYRSFFVAYFSPSLLKSNYSNSFQYSFLYVPFTRFQALTHLYKLADQLLLKGVSVKFINAYCVSASYKKSGLCLSISSGTSISSVSSSKVVIAAGAISSIPLLTSIFDLSKSEGLASDHLILYHGSIRTLDQMYRPVVQRDKTGYVLKAPFSEDLNSIYYSRPALFDFASLDAPILKRLDIGFNRSFSGIPSYSMGLLAEQLNNRFSITLPSIRKSIYSQTHCPNAYSWVCQNGRVSLATNIGAIHSSIQSSRRQVPYVGLKNLELSESLAFLPGIHLHSSLSSSTINNYLASEESIICVGPATIPSIGAEHHAFRCSYLSYTLGLNV